MLSISKRPCRLGPSINLRSEKHGDDDVPACDIAIEGLMLEPEELNALLEDPNAHKAFFAKAGNGKAGKLTEPMFRQLKAFVMRNKFEGGAVLTFGLTEREIDFGEVKLAKLTLEPMVGGLTSLSLQVQAHPDERGMGELMSFLNREIDAAIEIGARAEKGKRAQQDLPLSTFGEGEQTEEAVTH